MVRLLKADELAAQFGVTERTVIEWAKAGIIPEVRPSSRVRRFNYEEVLAALRNQRGPDVKEPEKT